MMSISGLDIMLHRHYFVLVSADHTPQHSKQQPPPSNVFTAPPCKPSFTLLRIANPVWNKNNPVEIVENLRSCDLDLM